MPIYEYRCSSCGHQQEFLQKLSDPPVTVCTACGKPTFDKMLTAAGFQLKGSGWYATDFKDKPAAAKSGAKGTFASDSKGDSKAESKGEAKNESKSEAKTETKTEAKPAAQTKSDGGKAAN
jgi:putative FmdB family regulatory protein